MKLAYPIQLIFLVGLIFSAFSYIDFAITGILLLVAAVWAIHTILSKRICQVYTLSTLMLVYLVWLYVVTFASAIPNASMTTLAILAGMPVMYLVATNLLAFSAIWKNLRVALFLLSVFLAALAIWQVANKIGYGNAQGPLADRNAYAALMNLIWFPATYLFFANKASNNRWLQPLLAAGLFIISIALFATASRGGILSWVLLLPFLLWVAYKQTKSKQRIAGILVIAVLAYFFSAKLLHSNIADRTFQVGPSTQIGQLSKDASTSARLMLWQSTIKIAKDHPIVGTGWGTFSYYYPAYRLPAENSTSGFFTHNDYLQLAAEGGFVAMLLQLSVLLALVLQLKKLFKRNDSASFESVTLLLGVLAIFIHALVNFIFYFAFMSIITGLYLARVAQLTETPRLLTIPSFSHIRASIKYLLAGFFAMFFAAPYAMHLTAQLCLTGDKLGLNAINFIAPAVTETDVARVITAVHPQEGLAQEYMIRTYEYLLSADSGLDKSNLKAQCALLTEALARFDSIRAATANQPILGVREVKLLMANQLAYKASTMANDTAYIKAYQILNDNLKATPYDANSLIIWAKLQYEQGKKAESATTLQYALNRVLSHRDGLLVTVELLRQRASAKQTVQLDNIEQALREVKAPAESGDAYLWGAEFYKSIEARLQKVLEAIESTH